VKKVLAQAWKEFMLFRRDKLLVLLAVLMPIVLMLLAGVTGTLRLRNVSLLVYDYDNTPLSWRPMERPLHSGCNRASPENRRRER
jgi:hypothetical protein